MNRLLPTKCALTVGDLCLLEWPYMTPRDREFWLWEATGFPWFFHRTPELPTNVHVLRQQMRDFREGRYIPDCE